MENLAKELKEFNQLLRANASADWSVNNPSQEFSSLADKLQKIIDLIPDERAIALEKLSHLICEDEDSYEDMEGALKLLEEQAKIDGSVMADDIVMMWEKVEWSFTVDELLNEIGM